MTRHKPTIVFHGPAAEHDQTCAVFHDEYAVYECNSGVFAPSWRAQEHGWYLVRAKGIFGRWMLRTFFNLEGTANVAH